jgi:hypothetical protein
LRLDGDDKKVLGEARRLVRGEKPVSDSVEGVPTYQEGWTSEMRAEVLTSLLARFGTQYTGMAASMEGPFRRGGNEEKVKALWTGLRGEQSLNLGPVTEEGRAESFRVDTMLLKRAAYELYGTETYVAPEGGSWAGLSDAQFEQHLSELEPNQLGFLSICKEILTGAKTEGHPGPLGPKGLADVLGEVFKPAAENGIALGTTSPKHKANIEAFLQRLDAYQPQE